MTDQIADGQPSDAPKTGGAILRSPFILSLLSVLALFWGVTLAVMAIDPLDLYDWGSPPELLPDYNHVKADYLYSAASRADVDVLLIGGSSLASITSAQLKNAYQVPSAFNFSVSAPRPADRQLILDKVIEHSPADRIIIGLDWVFALPEGYSRNSLPLFLFDDDPLNDLRLASPTVIALAWQKLNGRPLGLEGWSNASFFPAKRRYYERFQSAMSDTERPYVFRASHAVLPFHTEQCAAFPMVSQRLAQAIAALTERGKKVDILIPPYSLRLYAVWDERDDDSAKRVRPFLETQLAIRRCVVEQSAPNPDVAVFAFDNEQWITGDITNYRDEAHLQHDEIFAHMVQSMAVGNNRLTPDSFETYARRLTERLTSAE